MPKAPILSRTAFYVPIRGAYDPSTSQPPLKRTEWNAVETELGTCVEPVTPIQMDASGVNSVAQVDFIDASISRIQIIDGDIFQNQYGTGGPQIPGENFT